MTLREMLEEIGIDEIDLASERGTSILDYDLQYLNMKGASYDRIQNVKVDRENDAIILER